MSTANGPVPYRTAMLASSLHAFMHTVYTELNHRLTEVLLQFPAPLSVPGRAVSPVRSCHKVFPRCLLAQVR